MEFCINLNFYSFISLSAPSSVTRVPSREDGALFAHFVRSRGRIIMKTLKPESCLGRTAPFSLTLFAQEGWIILKILTWQKKANLEHIDLHWSSVKEFSCLKAIDFALEAVLKFWFIHRIDTMFQLITYLNFWQTLLKLMQFVMIPHLTEDACI